MGTVRNTPAYMTAMASDVGDVTPFYASNVAGGFTPAMGAPFYASSWSGKSNYTPMSPNIGTDQSYSGTDSSYTFGATCNPGGGVAPYAFSWSVFNEAPPGCATLIGAAAQTANIGLSVNGGLGSVASCQLQSTVTDGDSRVVASNVVNLQLEFV